MPALTKEVKQVIESTYVGPVALLIAQEHSKLIKQGAEAKVYKTTLYPSPTITHSSSSSATPSSSSTSPTPPPPVPILIKHRFPKAYRHPTLDALLTKQRLQTEARALVRCQKSGVRVPGLRLVDARQGCLGMEWIEGWSVREVLGGGQEDDMPEEDEEEGEGGGEVDEEDVGELLRQRGVDEDLMLHLVGLELAKMHIADIIHGDLTTSNMMVRLLTEEQRQPGKRRENEVFEVVLIDFGLSSASPSSEERAVDLYVLERAFASTHPVLPGARPHFERVLEGYKEATLAAEKTKKARKGSWEGTEKRLEDVRMRGRKRSMVG